MASFSKAPSVRMQNIKRWMNEKAAPAIGKFGNQTHLSALRDGFATILPLIIASALGLIIATSIFGGFDTEKSSLLGVFARWGGEAFKDSAGNLTSWGKASEQMTRVFGVINNFGLDLLTVYFTFTFGFFLSKARGNNSPEIGGLVALGCFFIATAGGRSSATFINVNGAATSLVANFMNASGLFTSIFITIFSIEIYCKLSSIKKLELNLPAGVPPAVARSFTKLIPVIVAAMSVAGLFALVAVPTSLTNADVLTSQRDANNNLVIGVSKAAPNSFYNIGDAIYMAVQSPFLFAAGIQGANLGIAVLYAFVVCLLWFFGIHGANISEGIFGPVFLALLANNAELLKQGSEVLAAQGNVFVYNVPQVFVLLGGSGATLPLVFGTLLFGKKPAEKAIAKFSIPAGVFNINEPVTFGYPLVANFVYMVPYLLVMPILTVTTWLLWQLFGTTYTTVVVPWTAPPGIGALFATQFDWSSFVIVVINFAIAFALWTPFVLLSNRIDANAKKKEQAAEAQTAKDKVV